MFSLDVEKVEAIFPQGVRMSWRPQPLLPTQSALAAGVAILGGLDGACDPGLRVCHPAGGSATLRARG